LDCDGGCDQAALARVRYKASVTLACIRRSEIRSLFVME
jgi:hypothetical protein